MLSPEAKRRISMLFAAAVCLMLAVMSPYLAFWYKASFLRYSRLRILDRRINRVFHPGVQLETVARGFRWAEGPLAVMFEGEHAVLLSDVKANAVFMVRDAGSDGVLALDLCHHSSGGRGEGWSCS